LNNPAPACLEQGARLSPGLTAVLGATNGFSGGTLIPLAQPSIGGILRSS